MYSTLFSWIATIYGGEVRLAVPMLFALGFLFLFTIGGLTGVMLSNASIDVAFHDTILNLYLLNFPSFNVIFNIRELHSLISHISQTYFTFHKSNLIVKLDKIIKYKASNKQSYFSDNVDIIPICAGGGYSDTKSESQWVSPIYSENITLHNGKIYKSNLSSSYIKKFWIGLLEGDGSIQVNHWNYKILQYRLIIKLKYLDSNRDMLIKISKVIGGNVRIIKDVSIIWVINDKASIKELIKIFDQYPLLTSRKICQLNFLKINLLQNDINWYLDNRNYKYNNQADIIKLMTNKFSSGLIKEEYLNCWLSGFIEAEGCFSNRKTNNNSFSIGQNYDLYILEYIKLYFNATNKIRFLKDNFYIIEIYKKEALNNIVNHINKYPLLGGKNLSFIKFKI